MEEPEARVGGGGVGREWPRTCGVRVAESDGGERAREQSQVSISNVQSTPQATDTSSLTPTCRTLP